MQAGKKDFVRRSIAHYRATRLDADAKAAVEDLRLRMVDLCSRCVNKAQVELFGSLVTGFCKPGCDADLSLTYRNFSPWHQGLSYVAQQDARRLTRVSREAGNMGMEKVRFIHARIPVVQFEDPVSGTHCDITIGNLGGVENSKILAAVHGKLPDFYGAYVHCVKEWAKRREMIDPNKLLFNSFTMTTMALMVLQELGLLPIFKPTGEMGELTLADAQHQLSTFELPPVYEGIEQDDERLGEAVYFCLLRFAEYYSKFDFTNGTVSLMCPRRHRALYRSITQHHLKLLEERKRAEWTRYLADGGKGEESRPMTPRDFPEGELKAAMQSEVTQRTAESPFIVEDFVNYVNCGRRVPHSRIGHTRQEFQRLYDAMRREDTVSYDEVFRESNVVPLAFDPDAPNGRVQEYATKH